MRQAHMRLWVYSREAAAVFATDAACRLAVLHSMANAEEDLSDMRMDFSRGGGVEGGCARALALAPVVGDAAERAVALEAAHALAVVFGDHLFHHRVPARAAAARVTLRRGRAAAGWLGAVPHGRRLAALVTLIALVTLVALIALVALVTLIPIVPVLTLALLALALLASLVSLIALVALIPLITLVAFIPAIPTPPLHVLAQLQHDTITDAAPYVAAELRMTKLLHYA